MFFCLATLATAVPAVDAGDSKGKITTLYVIGDSTAAAYPEERFPLNGWAQVLQDYFDPERLRVEDRAKGGRSSKSFYEEGSWTPIREALRPGDWVFIQFAHNDQKKDDSNRFTDPSTTFPEHLRRYVDEARAAGARPVLLTPINRNRWISLTRLGDTHGDYPDATRRLAREIGVPLIDLHRLTRKRFSRLGPDATTKLFLNLAPGEHPNYPEGKEDNTHLQESGAREVSALAVKGIKRLPLRACLKNYREARYARGFTKSARVFQTSSI
jgi:lysophospholipase L1-like esterase